MPDVSDGLKAFTERLAGPLVHGRFGGQVLLGNLDMDGDGRGKGVWLPGRMTVRRDRRQRWMHTFIGKGENLQGPTRSKEEQADTPMVAIMQRIPLWRQPKHALAGTFYSVLMEDAATVFIGVAWHVTLVRYRFLGTLIHTAFVEASGNNKQHLKKVRDDSRMKDFRSRWHRMLHNRLWWVFAAAKWILMAFASIVAIAGVLRWIWPALAFIMGDMLAQPPDGATAG